MRRRGFYLPSGTRLVSAVPDLDWDRWLAEAKTKREAREAILAEHEKHYGQEEEGCEACGMHWEACCCPIVDPFEKETS